MDSNIFTRSFDESLIRELPHLRIAPLREPVSSRNLRVPLTLEPNANRIRESGTIPKNGNPAGTLPPLNEPTGAANLIEGTTNPARLKNDFTPESLLEPPPRPILPAFVNLRALERFPYSSFDDDGHQSRKRRRIDLQPESFGEHVQLPMPHTQKEQRPPPFGPFAILNGLNEPPPNAALLPPIEAGSITQLLTKPSRDSIYVEPGLLTTSFTSDTTSGERREGRIADILDSPVTEKPSPCEAVSDNDKAAQSKHERDVTESTEAKPAEDTDAPLSPKTRGRSRKNIRRWTDDETIALLRGVISCGIGNWKEILAQQESNFNKRSASNLKDRFRVCCPSAYR
ncbi:telomere repeat binding factor family protein [Aspergillus undulatus]|uniref:telomere repeat binding factor family protein n=1 Tax=Aspergillus undulatus TaxID=1810928 RepID=UPI003CCD3FF5